MLAKLASWFGSDVYERYTAIYTWQSNQMAHTTMGFAFASLVILDARLLGWSPWWGLAFILLPIAKDVTDLLADLSKPRNWFPPPVGEMIVDALADDSYWFGGTAAATAVAVQLDPGISNGAKAGLWIGVIVFIPATILWTGRRFGREKRRLDGAALPYYARLPNVGSPMSGDTPSTIAKFLYPDGVGATGTQHLVIAGYPDSGKSELAIAIGSELVVAGEAVRYETALKFYDFVEAGKPARPLAKNEPIFVQDASVLIVDDAEAPPAAAGGAGGGGVMKAMPTPGFVAAITAGRVPAIRWVWVLDDPATAGTWRGFLAAAFGPGAVIDTVTLDRLDRPPPAPPSTAAQTAALLTLGATAALLLATIGLVVRALI